MPSAAIAAHEHARLGGVIFAKLFPNDDEPFRGIFVAEQLRATADRVDWSVVAPVPWVPKRVARALRKPYASGERVIDGSLVMWPRYPVLPKRWLYATVAPLIALTARGAFRRACARTDAAFVHVHDLYPSGAAGRRLCDAAGLPYVLTVHGLDLYSNLENPRWKREILAAGRGARAVICVGERLATDVIDELGVDPAVVTVIPNTYDDRRYTHVERTRGPVLRILSVGRLSHEKGHDVLLRAFAQARAAGVSATLTMVGDGPERSALEALAHDLGVDTAVEFKGVLLDEPLAAEMRSADLFVLPSRSEGFGVVLIEALATGLPVVATRSGGPDGIVAEGDGVLVTADDVDALFAGLRDAIERLDTFDSAAIAARAAARYSPQAVGGMLVSVYEAVLAGAPVPNSIGARR
ncbi:MAG: glycosyltransferase family 4 protein [Actinobacteria bacterium]|nr:MAG: glycosyltransferase family 4 protein [Actinomycetota bacterium]